MKRYICHCGNILRKEIEKDETADGNFMGYAMYFCDKCGNLFDEEDLKEEKIKSIEE